jgi:hypothetical protein
MTQESNTNMSMEINHTCMRQEEMMHFTQKETVTRIICMSAFRCFPETTNPVNVPPTIKGLQRHWPMRRHDAMCPEPDMTPKTENHNAGKEKPDKNQENEAETEVGAYRSIERCSSIHFRARGQNQVPKPMMRERESGIKEASNTSAGVPTPAMD